MTSCKYCGNKFERTIDPKSDFCSRCFLKIKECPKKLRFEVEINIDGDPDEFYDYLFSFLNMTHYINLYDIQIYLPEDRQTTASQTKTIIDDPERPFGNPKWVGVDMEGFEVYSIKRRKENNKDLPKNINMLVCLTDDNLEKSKSEEMKEATRIGRLYLRNRCKNYSQKNCWGCKWCSKFICKFCNKPLCECKKKELEDNNHE